MNNTLREVCLVLHREVLGGRLMQRYKRKAMTLHHTDKVAERFPSNPTLTLALDSKYQSKREHLLWVLHWYMEQLHGFMATKTLKKQQYYFPMQTGKKHKYIKTCQWITQGFEITKEWRREFKKKNPRQRLIKQQWIAESATKKNILQNVFVSDLLKSHGNQLRALRHNKMAKKKTVQFLWLI